MKKLFTWFKNRHELKEKIIQRERRFAAEERLFLINEYESKLKKQRKELRVEYEKELKKEISIKNIEIQNLKKLLRSIKIFGDNLQVLSSEFAVELESLLVVLGKMQNRFVNIEYRAHRETRKIEKKSNKVIGENNNE